MARVPCGACVNGFNDFTADGIHYSKVKCPFCDYGFRTVPDPVKVPAPTPKNKPIRAVERNNSRSRESVEPSKPVQPPTVAGWRVLVRTASGLVAFVFAVDTLSQTDMDRWTVTFVAIGVAAATAFLVSRRI